MHHDEARQWPAVGATVKLEGADSERGSEVELALLGGESLSDGKAPWMRQWHRVIVMISWATFFKVCEGTARPGCGLAGSDRIGAADRRG